MHLPGAVSASLGKCGRETSSEYTEIEVGDS
jgi:hypothetical protein